MPCVNIYPRNTKYIAIQLGLKSSSPQKWEQISVLHLGQIQTLFGFYNTFRRTDYVKFCKFTIPLETWTGFIAIVPQQDSI